MHEKLSDAALSVVTLDGVLESAPRQEFDKLCEDGPALIHERLLEGRCLQEWPIPPRNRAAKLKSCTPSLGA
jgi:hypothetical protein